MAPPLFFGLQDVVWPQEEEEEEKNTLSVAAEVQHPDSVAAKPFDPQSSECAHWQEFEVVERLPPRKHKEFVDFSWKQIQMHTT